jgi:ribonuclease PH
VETSGISAEFMPVVLCGHYGNIPVSIDVTVSAEKQGTLIISLSCAFAAVQLGQCLSLLNRVHKCL